MDIRNFFGLGGKSGRKGSGGEGNASTSQYSKPVPVQSHGSESDHSNRAKNDNVNTKDVAVANDLGSLENGPKQPKLQKFPYSTINLQRRAFCPGYYEQYEWIEYSVQRDAVFCFVCRHFQTQNKGEATAETFTKIGFKNWSNQKQKFDKHASSVNHKNNLQAYTQYKQTAASSSGEYFRILNSWFYFLLVYKYI